MGNCLVTKLKATVDNGNLQKLGVFTIKRHLVENETADDAFFTIIRSDDQSEHPVKLKIVGDGYFMWSYGGASIGKEIVVNIDGGSSNCFTSNGEYTIEVENKYYAYPFLQAKAYEVNLDDTYWLRQFSVLSICCTGNFASLNPDNISSLIVNYPTAHSLVYDDDSVGRLVNVVSATFNNANLPRLSASAVGKLVKLTGANQLSNLEGSIEDFVRAQRAGGRTSFDGTLNLKWVGATGNVTFNGATIANQEAGNITWTASTITFRGTTINA